MQLARLSHAPVLQTLKLAITPIDQDLLLLLPLPVSLSSLLAKAAG
jgi:hypothetical protein